MAKKKEKKKNYVQRLIPLIILAVLGYTIISFILQFTKGIPPDDTLTRMYFAFWSIEIINLARIKISKVKNSEGATVKGASKIIKDVVEDVFHSDETE